MAHNRRYLISFCKQEISGTEVSSIRTMWKLFPSIIDPIKFERCIPSKNSCVWTKRHQGFNWICSRKRHQDHCRIWHSESLQFLEIRLSWNIPQLQNISNFLLCLSVGLGNSWRNCVPVIKDDKRSIFIHFKSHGKHFLSIRPLEVGDKKLFTTWYQQLFINWSTSVWGLTGKIDKGLKVAG